MSRYEIPAAGAAGEELARKAHIWWQEAAQAANINLDGFDPTAPLHLRLAWAALQGLDITAVLSRFSTKLQHSTESQVKHCVEFAARKGFYVPPELICVDEAQKGRKVRRDGLERVKAILSGGHAKTLVVFMMSRILRTGYKSFAFIAEEVVEEGLRALSVMQGIDTSDDKTWKPLCYLHGLMDELLLDAIADHCRGRLKTLFAEGYTTGALPVCYHQVEVPGPLTKRGRPRTMAAVDEKGAEMLRRHWRWHLDGMRLRHGWKRWLTDGGPCDPRSPHGRMSYAAYRRMFSRAAYTGLFAFGRKKNVWSSKRDYMRQKDQPELEVVIRQCEELRIISDEDYYAMQQLLAKLKKGPRGPRRPKNVQLWDLTTEFFFCPVCSALAENSEPVRFYQTGAHGRGMQCKHGANCPQPSAVKRKEAVLAVLAKLSELIPQDTALIESVICRTVEKSATGDVNVEAEIKALESAVRNLTARIDDLSDLAGQGSEQDRAETKSKVREAQLQRAAKQEALAIARANAERISRAISPEEVRKILADMNGLLQSAAAGELEEEAVYKVLAIFRRLVGGRIWVNVEKRAGRKQTIVRGTFQLHLLHLACELARIPTPSNHAPADEFSVWLRPAPLRDRLAPRVRQLIEDEGHSYRSAAKVLQAEGYKINSGVVWQIYRRYYEMIGQPMPKRPYNNGRERGPE